ncbi:hypothetical protein G6F35_018675 [Rhizopus arrhizus]|nr:hypothetical protein G6F35_018675 [Rhizopus arrhizus]
MRDLPGHRLALQNTASTSAYLVPVMTLLQEGLSPQILAGDWDMPGRDSVGYVFARSERGEQRGLERRAAGAGRVPARLPRAAAHRAVPACGGDGPLRP